MTLPARFAEAAEKISSGALGNLPQSCLLDLYGLYSVACKGPAPSSGPSAFLDPRGFAKWNAWLSVSHLEKDEAMQGYIDTVATLQSSPLSNPQGQAKPNSDAFGNKASKGFDMPSPDASTAQPPEHDICYWATIGNVPAVIRCLERDAGSRDFRDQDALTPLMRAVDRNEQQVVDVLVEAGARLDATDAEGQTALHYAVYCEHADMAALLVSYGASTHAKDADGMTPLDVAEGEVEKAMAEAQGGRWKRKTPRYRSTGERQAMGSIGMPSIEMTARIGIAVSIVVLACVALQYRWRR